MAHNFNNIFEAEDCEWDKYDFYENCTFLRSLGKYRKGDKVKSIYIERDGAHCGDRRRRARVFYPRLLFQFRVFYIVRSSKGISDSLFVKIERFLISLNEQIVRLR